jgi:hypothetical protein
MRQSNSPKRLRAGDPRAERELKIRPSRDEAAAAGALKAQPPKDRGEDQGSPHSSILSRAPRGQPFLISA